MHRVIRPPLWQRLAQLLALVALAVFLLAVGLSQQGPARYVAEIAGAASLVVAGRGWTLRIVVGPDAIGLVNWFRTVVIAWDDVAGFRYDGRLTVRTGDGQRVVVSAFADARRAFAFARRPGAEAAAELEGLRRRRGEGPLTPP